MDKSEYDNLSDNMKIAFEHLKHEFYGDYDDDGNEVNTIDIRPDNADWELFCRKNSKFIDSIGDKNIIRNIRCVFDSGFNSGFLLATRFYKG